MTSNSGFPPLSNPSERPDNGRRPPASSLACQNSPVGTDLGLYWLPSGECRFIVLRDFRCCHAPGSFSSLCSDAKLSVGTIQTYPCSNPPTWGLNTRCIPLIIQFNQRSTDSRQATTVACRGGSQMGSRPMLTILIAALSFVRRDHRRRCASRFCGVGY